MALLRILDIKNPLLLFNTKDPKQTYREMMIRYHPDKHPAKTEWATNITAHVSKLYNEFSELIVRDLLPNEDTLNLVQMRKHPGYHERVYRDKVVYIFDAKSPTIDRLVWWIYSPWDYKNTKMMEEFSRYLPDIHKAEVHSNVHYSIQKDPSVIPLLSAWEQCKKKIPAKTVAWMISRMLNLSCYFFVNNIVYNGFLIKNLYVEPEKHLIFPYGGWWTSHKYGEKPTLMDKEALNCIPKKAMSGVSKINTDLYLIKHTARKLLGSPMPAAIPSDIPTALARWLFDLITKDPIETYREWYQVLQDSWGKRVFVPWNVTSPHVYNV